MMKARGLAILILPLVLVALVLAGCPKRPGTAAGVAAPAPGGSAATGAGQSGGSSSASSGAASQGPQTGKDAAALKPSDFARTERLKDIRFDFDKYDIRTADAKVLDANAAWLKANGNVQVLIEGHCDERGTLEYNLALGDRRAKAAMAYLIGQGINASRLRVISYGEERPLCAAHDETCWGMNRRDHFLGRAQ